MPRLFGAVLLLSQRIAWFRPPPCFHLKDMIYYTLSQGKRGRKVRPARNGKNKGAKKMRAEKKVHFTNWRELLTNEEVGKCQAFAAKIHWGFNRKSLTK